ncbi:MAG: type II toxin-antitoxin system HicB family antitoxin [Actinobacteria bacterium]|nr:type II toxin-antitoxin system HicB family antitoxin [Actinomycetota bacterium]
MVQTNSDKAEQLAQRPWSRVLVPDEGVIAASVPELRGCFAEGATLDEALANLEGALQSWLSAAVESGLEIPQPHGEVEPEEYSGRFSVRVPKSLHRRLATRADSEGCSLNQLVTTILAEAVEGPAQTNTTTTTDAYEDVTADAIGGEADSIGALKGIATFLRNRGDTNLACLVYSFAAERIAGGAGGAQESAKEFGTAGALARRERKVRLAETLWRQSLRRDYTNIRSRSSLGQLLHHQGRYEEAVEHLDPVADVDDYARLFLGWSRLQLGLAESNDEVVNSGLADVIAALRRWCAYASRTDRSAWLRQVRRLYLLGPRFREEIEQLVSFANSNANWPPLRAEEIEDASKVEDEDHEPVEEPSSVEV